MVPDNAGVTHETHGKNRTRSEVMQMYANGGEPRVGDVVKINGGDTGVAYELVKGGFNGEEAVQVRWTTEHEYPEGSGMKKPRAASTIPTRLLELVSRG